MSGQTVWLIGMMGAGKSAVGAALAGLLDVPFVDADVWVEERAGRSVARIFQEDGEAAFRAFERQAIESLGGAPGVVALGGGAMAQPGVPDALRATGRVVYLQAAVETLAERVGEGAERPLLAGLTAQERLARLRALLGERARHYALADHAIDTEGRDVQEVAQVVARELER